MLMKSSRTSLWLVETRLEAIVLKHVGIFTGTHLRFELKDPSGSVN